MAEWHQTIWGIIILGAVGSVLGVALLKISGCVIDKLGMTVEPIRKLEDIRAIKQLLTDTPVITCFSSWELITGYESGICYN